MTKVVMYRVPKTLGAVQMKEQLKILLGNERAVLESVISFYD